MNTEVHSRPVTFRGDVIQIFGSQGCILSEESWLMSALNDEVMAERDPDPASQDIEGCIRTDFESGKGQNIHHIVTDQWVGIRLFLEGRISREKMEQAELNEQGLVVRDVRFITPCGARFFDIHIVKNAKPTFATIDANGCVV